MAATGWQVPPLILEPIHLIGGAAIPAMLIAFGMSLNGSKPLQAAAGRRLDALLASFFKLVVHPLMAYLFARFALGMEEQALFAAVVTAALPTAQNVFVAASRYRTGVTVAKDTVLITTVVAVPGHDRRGPAAGLTCRSDRRTGTNPGGGPLKTTLDTVVIGGGAMGSAAAWALARRGRDVTLLEQFGPGHRNGASHGTTRNFNPGYADPDYVAMLAEAARLWSELETDSGERLLARTGVVNHGTDPRLPEVRNALLAAGLRAEFLSAEEAAERWRGIRFETRVLHMADGGQLNPDAALPALQRLAAGLGAEIRHHVKVLELKVLDDGVRLTAGVRRPHRGAHRQAGRGHRRRLDARSCSAGVAPLPRLTVTQEQPAHFAITDDGAQWPGFNHMPGQRGRVRVLAFARVRHANAGRGDQGRMARGGPGGGPGPADLRSGARPAGRPAALRPGLAARGRRRLPHRHQLHLHDHRWTRTSSWTGSARWSSAPASPATASSSPRSWAGSWPTSRPATAGRRPSSRRPAPGIR